MLNYEGIFLDEKSIELIRLIEENKLELTNDQLHCTFKYKPNRGEIFNDIVGKEFELYLVGYGNDGMNSGFEVVLPEELNEYYINYDNNNNLKVPHITTSLSKGAKAVNTANLEFKKLKKPIKVTGKFGYWLIDEKDAYISFEQYEISKQKRV